MPRCSSTEKFAGYDDAEVEVESEELTDTTLSVSVRSMRPCAECGEDFAEYTFEIETDVECPTCGTEAKPACPDCEARVDGPDADCETCHGTGVDEEADEEAIEFELENVDVEGTDRNQTTNTKGKPIPYRYQKRFLGVEVTATITCGHCHEEFEVTASDEAQASWFESLV